MPQRATTGGLLASAHNLMSYTVSKQPFLGLPISRLVQQCQLVLSMGLTLGLGKKKGECRFRQEERNGWGYSKTQVQ